MSEVLYRKWRPQSFAEVVGQDAVTRTLRNAVASGRLAHAYLLCGPRGTGKTTLGRLVAKAANCAAPADGEPCNTCDSCRAFLEGRAIDFIEQDAASHNGVDDIRQLRENVALTPMAGERKVYLLDEVHMLSTPAENALLKTLEEPPPHIIFVLATTESQKLPPTIVSRCQRFDLKRIPMTAAVGRMAHICAEEGFTIDKGSLEEVARATTGSLRDGINALEQVVSYYGTSPTPEQVREALGLTLDARCGELARIILEHDLTGGLRLIASVNDDGVEIKTFAKQLTQYLRGLLLAKAGAPEALELPQEMAAEVRSVAAKLDKNDILRALQTFGRIDWRDDHSSLPLELALVDFVSLPPSEARAPVREAAPLPKPQRAEPRMAPPPLPPPAQSPAPPPAPKREPEFSMPVADLDAVEATVTTSSIQSPSAEAEPVAAADPGPAPVPVEASAGANGAPHGDLLDRVRLAFKDSDKQLSAVLNGSCEITSTDEDTVVLGFFHTFHLERIEGGSFRSRLEAEFSKQLGKPVKVAFQHAPKEQRPADTERKGGHLVQAAREAGARAVMPDD